MTERTVDASVIDPLDILAEEFVHRLREGEHPSLTEYHRAASRAGRADPGPVPRPGGNGGGRSSDSAHLRAWSGPPRRSPTGSANSASSASSARAAWASSTRRCRSRWAGTSPSRCCPHCRDADAYLERFRREARTAARLHHTNIVPVFGVGDGDGVHYYAMQFIQGQGLDAVLREVRAPAGGRSRSPRPKPGRSQRQWPGAYTVASSPRRRPRRTRRTRPPIRRPESDLPGAVRVGLLPRGGPPGRAGGRGTGLRPRPGGFASRHQAVEPAARHPGHPLDHRLWPGQGRRLRRPDPHRATWSAPSATWRRSSSTAGPTRGQTVYALGATLYELLTLRPAFPQSRSPRTDGADRARAPPPPRRHEPRIPRDLETIVLKAMARDPADRYRSAAELAEDLRRFLGDRPIRARRISPAEALWRLARRNRLVAGLAASIALLLIVLAVGASLAAVRMGRDRDQARQAERERTRQLARSLLDQARAARFGRRPGQRFESLDAIRRASVLARQLGEPASFYDELRTQAIACLALADVQIGTGAAAPGPLPAGFATAAADRYVTIDPSGQVRVARMGDEHEIARRSAYPGQSTLRLSDDGSVLAVRSVSGAFRAWDLRRSDPAPIWDEPTGACGHDVRRDGAELALIRADGTLIVRSPVRPCPAPVRDPGRAAGSRLRAGRGSARRRRGSAGRGPGHPDGSDRRGPAPAGRDHLDELGAGRPAPGGGEPRRDSCLLGHPLGPSRPPALQPRRPVRQLCAPGRSPLLHRLERCVVTLRPR